MKKVLKSLAFIVIVAIIGFSCKEPVKTFENLKSAIQGETNASIKYTEFSTKAADEGFMNISKMFKAAAAAEAVHIKNHKAVLTKLGVVFEATVEPAKADTTTANIQAAIEGETNEVNSIYPGFITVAKEEKCDKAVKSFTWAMDVEKRHVQLYTEALNILKTTGNDSTVSGTWYVCPKCGNTYKSIDGVQSCELCGTASSSFQKF